MLEQQTIAQQQIEQLKATMQVQPVESEVARALEQMSGQVMAMLDDLSGDDFDRAYLDAQIGMHAKRLLLIDTLMMPAVSNATLEQMLVGHRAETQRQLATAVQRRAEIEE